MVLAVAGPPSAGELKVKITDIPGLFAKRSFESKMEILAALSAHMERVQDRVDAEELATPMDIVGDIQRWFVAAQMSTIYEAHTEGYFTREQAIEGFVFLQDAKDPAQAEKVLLELEMFDKGVDA
jgi:hypothetical protein